MPAKSSLKILAKDPAELAVLSGLLQDALVLVQDMTLDEQSGSFIAVFSRFMWERADQSELADGPLVETGDARFEDVPDEGDARFFRTHAALRLQGASKVETQNLPKDPKANLNLLSLQASEDHKQLVLTFSDGVAIRVTTKSLLAGLEDLGEPWPTLYKPDHQA